MVLQDAPQGRPSITAIGLGGGDCNCAIPQYFGPSVYSFSLLWFSLSQFTYSASLDSLAGSKGAYF